ncbi:hypothetical protein LJR219_001832 [Phenylobacterium sp. LjRoot219]|uniref:hypothetical protein n=1 Tax=Phenylobacterium sp. LjRoot219 TaxID=3342283 RepID=UPI003ECDB62E
MTLFSFSDVFSVNQDRAHAEEIRPGDIVRAGPDLHPQFEVIAMDGGKAWLRDVQTGADHLALLSRCRKVETQQTLAFAAA